MILISNLICLADEIHILITKDNEGKRYTQPVAKGLHAVRKVKIIKAHKLKHFHPTKVQC